MCGAIPQQYFDSVSSVPAADVAVHILDYLYKRLDEVCLVQGGEVGCLLLWFVVSTHSSPHPQ